LRTDAHEIRDARGGGSFARLVIALCRLPRYRRFDLSGEHCMKRILIAAAAAAILSSTAHAGDLFAGMYGNSLNITGSDGVKFTVYINQDMSWEEHYADGSVIKGTYAWKDPQTACFTQTTPTPPDPSKAVNCFGPQSEHKVGDSWSINGADGKPATLVLTAGR
jgi:hypothetical protein